MIDSHVAIKIGRWIGDFNAHSEAAKAKDKQDAVVVLMLKEVDKKLADCRGPNALQKGNNELDKIITALTGFLPIIFVTFTIHLFSN